MNVSRFIGRRLKFKGRIAVASIAVSYLVMIIAVSVASGFRQGIRDGISDMSGDVRITPVNLDFLSGTSPIERHPAYLGAVSDMKGVGTVSPVVYRAGVIKAGETIHGALFKGVESPRDSASLSVSIPERLSDLLGIKQGDDMLVYFIGEKIKMRKFKIGSVYKGILETDDNMIVYGSIGDMQRINGWSEEQVSAMEISLEERYRTAEDMEMMEGEIGYAAYVNSSEDEETVVATSAVSNYPRLFDWLGLIDFNVFFILALMTVVAGFNMISGLLIMLFENIPTIGLLKSLGMRNSRIAEIFLTSASSTVFKGMFIGNALALAFCFVQGTFRLIKLNPDNYFLSYVPVHPDILMIAVADIVSWIVIMALLLVSCLFISKVDPAKTVAVR